MKHTNPEQTIFFTMAVAGGFFGGYTIGRCGVLASAETVNLISLTKALLELDTAQILIRLGAALFFSLAIGLSTILLLRCADRLPLYAIAADIVGIVLTGFLPFQNEFYVLYPIFFVTGFQWNAFSGVNDYASSCVFSTNNLRQAVIGLTLYLRSGDREAGERAKFFGKSLLFFHIGVVFAFLSMRLFAEKSIFLCLIPVLAALGMQLRLRSKRGLD